MIFTNRDQRPKQYQYEAADIADMIGSAVTAGRIRQVARGYMDCGEPIGWLQFKVVAPDGGEYQFPFRHDHKYSQEDVLRVCEWVENCRKTDLRYKIKTDRWYSVGDLNKIVERSKKLKKKMSEGAFQLPEKKKAGSRPVKSAKAKHGMK